MGTFRIGGDLSLSGLLKIDLLNSRSSATTLATFVNDDSKQGFAYINPINLSVGSAAKLTTARTIRTNLASTSTASFDGSANITPGVTGTLPLGNGGTGQTTAAGIRGNIIFIGSNAITSTSADTTANWGALGSGVSFNTNLSQLNSQPNQWGLILNLVAGIDTEEVHQIWCTQSDGTMYHRGGNASGWGGNWKAILDQANYSTYCAPASHTHNYLPLSGGTMSGAITFASTGYYTYNDHGYYIDQYGNFYHRSSATGDNWNINSYNGSVALRYYPETGVLNVGGKVELWSDGEGGNIRIASPNGSLWSIDAVQNSELRFIWAERDVPVRFSSGGGIFGNSLALTSHNWSSGPNMSNAAINFGSTIDALTSTTHYKPWIGGSHGIASHGYYATITAGLYHTNDPSRGGFYIGASWDHNNADTFYYFARDGHFIAPRIVTNNYGSSFPSSANYIGEIFFKI